MASRSARGLRWVEDTLVVDGSNNLLDAILPEGMCLAFFVDIEEAHKVEHDGQRQ